MESRISEGKHIFGPQILWLKVLCNIFPSDSICLSLSQSRVFSEDVLFQNMEAL